MINIHKIMKNKKSLVLICFLLFIALFSSSIYAQNREVKIFAHRGGMLEYDENTISAFQETFNKGIRGYEVDIRMTKDGYLVLFHDDNFKRIIGTEGSIEESTLAEIKKMKTLKGNPIPSLDDFLNFLKDKEGLYVEFEMKTQKSYYNETVLAKYCSELYNKVNKIKRSKDTYLFTSFDKRPLRLLKAKDANVDLLFIKSEGLTQAVLDEAKELGINRLGCRVEKTTRDMVKNAKDQGFIVSLWPGRNINDFLLGVSLGSDMLCTDIPVEVMEWVKKQGSWITLK